MQERKKPEEIVPAINDPEKVISEDLIRKELKLKGIRLKIAQAQVDKIEIMRDLAAYEVNFASSCGVQQNLQSLLGKLISTEELLLRRRGCRHHEQEALLGPNNEFSTGSPPRVAAEDSGSWLSHSLTSSLFTKLKQGHKHSLLKNDFAVSFQKASSSMFKPIGAVPKGLKQRKNTIEGVEREY